MRAGTGGATLNRPSRSTPNTHSAHRLIANLSVCPASLTLAADGTLAKFGAVSDFPDLLERRSGGTVAPLLRTIEAWLRVDRNAKKAQGVKTTETAERAAQDELRGATGNGYLSGRFNNGYN